MAKLIVTLEIEVEPYTEAQLAAWSDEMGGGTVEDSRHMIREFEGAAEADEIAGIVADGVFIGCRMNGEAWAATEILAHVSEATVIAAAWKPKS